MTNNKYERRKTMQTSNTFSWVICLLNECSAKGDADGHKICQLVEQLLTEAEKAKIDSELVLVNNASTDNTGEVLAEIRQSHNGKVIVLDEPMQGKARAERTAFKFLTEKTRVPKAIVTMDADGEHDVRDMIQLCQVYERERPLFVVGSRFVKKKRNKKDEILRNLLVDLSGVKDNLVPDDPRCGARVYQVEFIRTVVNSTVSQNYGLELELVALGLRMMKENQQLRILSCDLVHYTPQRSKVFKNAGWRQEVNPELKDICCLLSKTFGKLDGDEEEGREIITRFGHERGRENLFSELNELFYKGKMVTDEGQKAPQEFMEAPPADLS